MPGTRGSAVHQVDHAGIRDAVATRMASFEAAERSLDADKLIAHFSGAGDFFMYHDGERLGYNEIAMAVRGAFPTLASLHGGFLGVEVHVLAGDAALATARFRETVTTTAGATVRRRGAATWLWRLRGDEWQIVYGHVDHYDEPPVADASQPAGEPAGAGQLLHSMTDQAMLHGRVAIDG